MSTQNSINFVTIAFISVDKDHLCPPKYRIQLRLTKFISVGKVISANVILVETECNFVSDFNSVDKSHFRLQKLFLSRQSPIQSEQLISVDIFVGTKFYVTKFNFVDKSQLNFVNIIDFCAAELTFV